MAWSRIGACLLAAITVVGACSGNDDDASPVTVDPDSTTTSETTTTTESTTTTENPEAAVEQAFYAQWDAFVEILEDPDPANPLIEEHFTGQAPRVAAGHDQ
ncbi:MAG: hypothetical protein U5K30_05940 [Acidimicrobiales bacterium]|nr:hypothetical protein [Acidimicrobiales bacterium]